MPAVMEDPSLPPFYRVSGAAPFHDQSSPPHLPADIVPRQVTLRDRQTVATIVPFASHHQLPPSLLTYLCDQFNKEIEGGDTYPMTDLFSVDDFTRYWFQNFGAVMLLGDLQGPGDITENKDWSRECLGSFYIKPNYPGRSSHVCNAGFLVTDASRNRGVGRLMGETYIDYAPRLGYTYSVFNLVYETNVASCRIWDALGFKRIGRVKGCGNLRSYPDRFIDGIIYGRDLAPPGEGEDGIFVSEERFDKIKYYLKSGKYPNGADRAEKSRLRSAATHYKLLDGDRLMLKDKLVISDPSKQLEIARDLHAQQHGGINKTTAMIAEKYHWSRIKETVSDVIRNCTECKDVGKPSLLGSVKKIQQQQGQKALVQTNNIQSESREGSSTPMNGKVSSPTPAPQSQSAMGLQDHTHAMLPTLSQPSPASSPGTYAEISSIAPSHTLRSPDPSGLHDHFHDQQHHSPHHQNHHHAYQPIDPQIINQDNPFESYHAHAADFQALLNVSGNGDDEASAAVDRDLEMLIEQGDDDDDGGGGDGGGGDDLETHTEERSPGAGGSDGNNNAIAADGQANAVDDVLMEEETREDKDRDMYELHFDGSG